MYMYMYNVLVNYYVIEIREIILIYHVTCVYVSQLGAR